MLITAATLFSSACHSHPFALLHFVFLRGTADSGKMVWVTCGILVLLALIYSKLHSCSLPKPMLLYIPTARTHAFPALRGDARMEAEDPSSVVGCLLVVRPRKEELLSVSFVHLNVSLFQSNYKLTFWPCSLSPETKFECKR